VVRFGYGYSSLSRFALAHVGVLVFESKMRLPDASLLYVDSRILVFFGLLNQWVSCISRKQKKGKPSKRRLSFSVISSVWVPYVNALRTMALHSSSLVLFFRAVLVEKVPPCDIP